MVSVTPRLDPQAQSLLDAAAASGLPPIYEEAIEVARQRMHAGFTAGAPGQIARRTDLSVSSGNSDVAVRIYHPAPDEVLPLVVFFHGGGWIVNDLDTHDVFCCTLASQARCVVASVDYSRAPEARYPIALGEGWDALVALAGRAAEIGADGHRIAVAGDSSGGALAAAIVNRGQTEGPVVAAQVLIYPVVDYINEESPSYRERGSGYSLNRDFMDWAYRNDLPEQWSREDSDLFPLLAADVTRVPPTLIVTAEFDPLRDEGRSYAHKLATSGVKVSTIHAESQMHGFILQQPRIDEARVLVGEISRWTHRALRAGLRD